MVSNLTISEVSKLMKKGHVSPVEVLDQTLTNISNRNNELNAYIEIMESQAKHEAKTAEKDISNGADKGPLHGVPISIKDLVAIKGVATTNGSIINRGVIEDRDAPLIASLRSAGAIIVGKTNLDEFANHIIGKNKNFGTIRNPINTEYTAGGSSGGSAVSVAANLAFGSVGTDTAGSVRIPAACCGLVGLKPTYNLISTQGITPLSWSLDTVGPLARNIEDLSIIFNAIAPGKVSVKPNKETEINKLTVGVPENYFYEDLDPEVKQNTEDAIKKLEERGATIEYIKINQLHNFQSTHITISAVESAYYHKQYLENYDDEYEPWNVDFFNNGLATQKSEYHKALIEKDAITRGMRSLFSNIDVIITPTMPINTPKLDTTKVYLGGKEVDHLTAMIRNTAPFNMSGLPALNIPYGESNEGLPTGLQLVGDIYNEELLLSVGKWLMDNK